MTMNEVTSCFVPKVGPALSMYPIWPFHFHAIVCHHHCMVNVDERFNNFMAILVPVHVHGMCYWLRYVRVMMCLLNYVLLWLAIRQFMCTDSAVVFIGLVVGAPGLNKTKTILRR